MQVWLPLDLTDASLSAGFYPLEHHDHHPVRWTSGRAVLTLPASTHTRRIAFHVAIVIGFRMLAAG